jgi:hypothetical protein
MTEQDKQIVIEALEYALYDYPAKDGDYQTHFNTFANAIEIVKNCSTTDIEVRSEQLCGCDSPLIRTSEKGGEYCGLCQKDLD